MKQDKRFDNIALEFGNRSLDYKGFMEALASEIHNQITSMEAVISDSNSQGIYYCMLPRDKK